MLVASGVVKVMVGRRGKLFIVIVMMRMDDDSDTSSVDSRVCNIGYDAMDGKAEEVISNFRIFAESTMKGKKEKVTVPICSIC
eukprot:7176340-Ditylum_brightwellii.AAC.1